MTTSVSADRRRAMLRTAMGAGIAAALADPRVLEIMVNPNGQLRLDVLGEGRVETGITIEADQVERIVRLVASHARIEISSDAPIVSAELPPREEGVAGERFEGLLPPVATGPCFSIRKPATRIHRLLDYVTDGLMDADTARILSMAVVERRNILVAGGTSSGKTTLANALLAEMAHLDERVILIEDTRELQSPAPDTVALRTRPGAVSMSDLVRSTLRLRPDRIVVGEVRGPEALDMLKAWNTGHPGGIATVHANSASSALNRIEQLVQEAVVTVPRALIADAIDIIVFIAGRGAGRRVDQVLRMAGVDPDGGFALFDLLTAPQPQRSLTMLATRRARSPRNWLLALPLALLSAGAARASGTGMPWEAPLQQILDSVQGPVAKIVAVIIIITTGLTLAFGETAGGFRRLIQIVFGLSIAFAASSFFLSFFSFGGGALVA